MRTAFNAQMVALGEELPASDVALEWDQFLDERRRQKRCARRNKRKKNLGLWDGEEDIEDEIDDKWLFGPDKSRTLTKRQEAALSRYLKVFNEITATTYLFSLYLIPISFIKLKIV